MKKYSKEFYSKNYSFSKLPLIDNDDLISYMMIDNAYRTFLWGIVFAGILYRFLEFVLEKDFFFIYLAVTFCITLVRFLHTKTLDICLDQCVTQTLSLHTFYRYDGKEFTQKSINAIKDLLEYLLPSKISIETISMPIVFWFGIHAIDVCKYPYMKWILSLVFGVMISALIIYKYTLRRSRRYILKYIKTIIEIVKKTGVEYDE